MFKFRRLLWAGAVALLSPLTILAQDLTVYDDTLQNGFQNYSYANPGDPVPDFTNTAQPHTGTKSISLNGKNFNAVSFYHATAFTTEIYAETDRQQAMDVIGKVG